MYNFTTKTYEMKREIVNFSKSLSNGMKKSERNFIMDVEYGIVASGICLISNIAIKLNEDIKLKNTIERICDNLNRFDKKDMIIRNYLTTIGNVFGEEPVAIFDDSDITKKYGKKFEDLDNVVDASSVDRKIKKGYHICEAVILTKEEKQPISVYSEIYSCKSKNFKSKNHYTLESIERVKKVVKGNFTGVFDRGYHSDRIIEYMDSQGNSFVTRMSNNRNFLFKGKKKKATEKALKRKGKIRMELWFDDNEVHEIYISHTKVTLPSSNKEYELVFCYGLKEDKPLILLTNRKIKNKEDVIKVVRLYFSRWRIEEYFRAKKQEFGFENIRLRTLKGINNLNLFLTVFLGLVNKLAENQNRKL